LTDPDTAASLLITTAVVTDPALLSAGISGAGSSRTLTVTPAANRHGSTTVDVTVSDGHTSTTTTVAVTVTPVNDAPVAADDAVTATAGVALNDSLAAADADGDPLTFSKVADPTKGTVTVVAATGAFAYTANASATGTDTFTFKANDGTVDSHVATVTVTITAAGGGGGGSSMKDDDSRCGLGGGLSASLLLLMGLMALLRRRA
jgi:hypothetical protein